MPADQQITFEFEGRAISCPDGVSLAAALASAGVYGLRSVGNDERRGVYCGIGVCQECRVDVVGQGRVRACMTRAADGMRVAGATRLADPPRDCPDASESEPVEVQSPEVLIIGGGAAGLTAAATLAESGADVILLDERSRPGGQYYKQPFVDERVHPSLTGDVQIREGSALVDRARSSGATLIEAAEIWGAFASGEFTALVDGASLIFRPRYTIVATGAFERGLPLPGWTLPGVMTSGAAQTLLKSYGELPGQRVLVTGNGPLNLQIAQELKKAGADVVAVTELAPSFMRRPVAALAMSMHDPALAIRGIGTLRFLKSARVPVLFGHGLHSVESAGGGLTAHIGPFDGRSVTRSRAFDVDVVCTGFGFLPNNEILRNLGCRHGFDPARGEMIVVRSADCETSVPGVFAIGDCCGLGGAPAACEEGIIAAKTIRRALADNTSAAADDEEHAARQRLASHRRFQDALWRLFAASRLQAELTDPDTFVCRCENVRMQDIRDAIEAGDRSIGAIKRRTRLGMGACQSRYCAPVAASLLGDETDQPVGEFSYFAPRVPIKPIRIADIANARPASGKPVEKAILGRGRSRDD